jgi:hypothetical protein
MGFFQKLEHLDAWNGDLKSGIAQILVFHAGNSKVFFGYSLSACPMLLTNAGSILIMHTIFMCQVFAAILHKLLAHENSYHVR